MASPASTPKPCVICGIQHFSLFNGPGLRTTVFFKGCPLRCAWCCNPESRSTAIGVSFDTERCIGPETCGLCIASCPKKAIYAVGSHSIGIARDVCRHCGLCTTVCPSEALFLNGKSCSVESILSEIQVDSAYIRSSGGVTLSGGEPFMRPRAAAELLEGAQQLGLHTVVETCGFFDLDDPYVRRGLQSTDILYYDLKHSDPVRHKQGTELENARILQNLTRIGQEFPNLPIVSRTTVVPGFNDSLGEMANLARIVSSIPTLLHHELSPCNTYCETKYEQLGIPCLYTFAGRPSVYKMREFANVFIEMGIDIIIV